MTLHDVWYTVKGQDDDPILIQNKGAKVPRSYLSPISTQILAASLNGNISLIFAQGPLQMTPLICVLMQKKEKQDILIGIPRILFNKQTTDYSRIFYSLYERQKSMFFYQNILFATAEVISSLSGDSIKLDVIKSRPTWGIQKFKNQFEETLKGKLKSGECDSWPKIVVIPIDYGLPEGLLQQTDFMYAKECFRLKPFSPKFVILESVNERVITLEPIKGVIYYQIIF